MMFKPSVVLTLLVVALSVGCSPEETTSELTQGLNESTEGSWSAPVTWPFVAIHTSVLPNGKVLSWGRTEEHHTPSASIWDPATGTLTSVHNETTNLFCSGHSFLPDGRLLVTGGHIHDGEGPADVNIFDYRNNTWSTAAPMNAGRWYPTNITLGTGEVAVVAGTSVPGAINSLPQVFTAAGTWRNLTTAERVQPYYPFMHVAPNGAVFYSGPERLTAMLYTAGTGTWVPFGRRSQDRYRTYGSSVMYRPGKIITMGGQDDLGFYNGAETIDLNVAQPAWTPTQSMAFARQHLNATSLPDGTVLVTGGLDANGAVFRSELWNPSTGTWTQLASNAVPRLYHSTTVLLPDGRVLTGGGGQPGVAGYGDYPSIELFSPPYLFKGARPTLTASPASANYGAAFTATVGSSAGVSRVTLVRLGSVTHAFDQNQRFLELTFTRPTATTLSVTAPANSNLAPPGHYMLFVLNAQGVPSTAQILQVTGTTQPAPVAPTPRTGPESVFFTATGNVICPTAGDVIAASCTSLPGAGFRFVTLNAATNEGALLAPNGRYVSAEGGGGGILVGSRTVLGSWEQLRKVPLGGNQFALQAPNGKYVAAEGGGGGQLLANRDVVGTWETFREASLSTVSLRVASNHYVCAENAGGSALVANRTAVGGWETFRLLNFGGGQVALQAFNGLYVTAEYGGGAQLIANRPVVGPWETLQMQTLGAGVSLRAFNGQYVCAEGGGGGAIVVNRPAAGAWETFRPTCLVGNAWCGGRCADTRNEATNCGGCGVTCSATQSCVNSACR